MWFEAAIAAAGIVAGAVASVAGFGIGSFLTPAFSVQLDTRLAVAAVSIPHAIGTALRLWLLGAKVNRRVLLSFGVMSAAGGLAGAMLHSWAESNVLEAVFGSLLLFVAASELSGLARRMRFNGPAAWIAGGVSGLSGGMVGNQGGIRSAALLGFDLSKSSFVATATAIGLIVDAARMPVYFAAEGNRIAAIWPLVAVATAGVVIGTLFGNRVLERLSELHFRRFVAGVLALLGAWMLWRGLA